MNAPNPTRQTMPAMRPHNADLASREEAAEWWWQNGGRDAVAKSLKEEDDMRKRERMGDEWSYVVEAYGEWAAEERRRMERRQVEEANLNDSKRKGRG